jgi:uncharacterized protein YcfJ
MKLFRVAAGVTAAAVLFTGCATVPTGPSVMVLPSQSKPFDQFQADDASCRQFAHQQVGATPAEAATNSTIGGAAVGTLIGAAIGALIGSSRGRAGTGAAVGAGVGMVGGAAVGASTAAPQYGTAQKRYDAAYTQCMYAKGHQVPVRGYAAQPSVAPPPPPPPAPASGPAPIPPPPVGPPPPPPPGTR